MDITNETTTRQCLAKVFRDYDQQVSPGIEEAFMAAVAKEKYPGTLVHTTVEFTFGQQSLLDEANRCRDQLNPTESQRMIELYLQSYKVSFSRHLIARVKKEFGIQIDPIHAEFVTEEHPGELLSVVRYLYNTESASSPSSMIFDDISASESMPPVSPEQNQIELTGQQYQNWLAEFIYKLNRKQLRKQQDDFQRQYKQRGQPYESSPPREGWHQAYGQAYPMDPNGQMIPQPYQNWHYPVHQNHAVKPQYYYGHNTAPQVHYYHQQPQYYGGDLQYYRGHAGQGFLDPGQQNHFQSKPSEHPPHHSAPRHQPAQTFKQRKMSFSAPRFIGAKRKLL